MSHTIDTLGPEWDPVIGAAVRAAIEDERAKVCAYLRRRFSPGRDGVTWAAMQNVAGEVESERHYASEPANRTTVMHADKMARPADAVRCVERR